MRDYVHSTLIVFGHGSTVNAQSGAPVFQQASALRERGLFGSVREAFWKQKPFLKDVLAETTDPVVFLAPLFISDGYFSEVVIPSALGFHEGKEGDFNRVLNRDNRTFQYCRAVGSHPRMGEVIMARANEVLNKFPFPRRVKALDTTLFVAGHGTEQNDNSRTAIELQAERARAANLYAEVKPVFLDEAPRINECYDLCATKNFVMVPFFIGDGMHVQEDIPMLLGEPERIVRQRLSNGTAAWRNPTERKGKLGWLSASVGTDPLVADVILDRVRELAK